MSDDAIIDSIRNLTAVYVVQAVALSATHECIEQQILAHEQMGLTLRGLIDSMPPSIQKKLKEVPQQGSQPKTLDQMLKDLLDGTNNTEEGNTDGK